MKTAFITGISGQDGSYLAELLLEKNYNVVGMIRRNSISVNQTKRIQHIMNDISLEYGDMTDFSSIFRIIIKYKPDEIYNLAAQSHVRISFDIPLYTIDTIINGTANILESIKSINPNIKMYQASSSEMFGNCIDSDGYQRESTPMNPVSPYGVAKLAAYNLINNYRNSYNMFLSNGILFNHESPRRGENFVSQKIIKEAVKIYKNQIEYMELGNLDAKRDWGHSKDYVNVMHQILQLDKSDNFVCSTGINYSVKDLCEYVCKKLNLDFNKVIKINDKFKRPEELKELKGDNSKLKSKINVDFKYNFYTMLDEMIEMELKNNYYENR